MNRTERVIRNKAEQVAYGGTLWIDVKWIEELGRERIQEVVAEYGFGPLRNHSGELTVRV